MIWAAWIALVGVSFVVLEASAIATGRETLSAAVWRLSRVFPPFPAVVGLIVGFLACHFWWYGAYCSP